VARPLCILAGLQRLLLGESPLAPFAGGDWRPVLEPALAALVCGFLWELWNYGSLAKWHYSIPFVQRFPLFEMPLLGYSGYLPFGVECALIMQLVATALDHSGEDGRNDTQKGGQRITEGERPQQQRGAQHAGAPRWRKPMHESS